MSVDRQVPGVRGYVTRSLVGQWSVGSQASAIRWANRHVPADTTSYIVGEYASTARYVQSTYAYVLPYTHIESRHCHDVAVTSTIYLRLAVTAVQLRFWLR